MTPEEIINKQTWEILQDIKEESLVPDEDGIFFYETTRTVIAAGENSPTRERKWAIVRKLAKEKVIEIVREVIPDSHGGMNGFYLKILQPKFNEIYENYKKTCDLTSYLDDYQEKMLKGEDPSDFLQLKSEAPAPVREKHKGQMFETGSGGGYYNRNHPIRPEKKRSASEIVNGFSPSNYAFVSMIAEGILSASEFGINNEANYQLQSAPGQMLMQERQLLSKFESLGLFRNLGEDGIFAIAKLRNIDIEAIRQITTEIKSRQLNLQAKPEEKTGNLNTRYGQLLEEIGKPGQISSELKERYNKLLGKIKSQPKSLDVSKQKNNQAHAPTPNDRILACGLLKINLDQSTIQYKDIPAAEISTGVNIIKFLLILLENKRVVEYIEIAQRLKLNCYHTGATNKDVAREVQFLRRDLGDFLVKIGMDKTEVQKMFISKRNVGYKLSCNN